MFEILTEIFELSTKILVILIEMFKISTEMVEIVS